MARAVRYLARRFPERRPRFALTTNGLLLTEPRLAFLERHRFEVQISADGARSAQELRAPGTFARLNRILDRMRAPLPASATPTVAVVCLRPVTP